MWVLKCLKSLAHRPLLVCLFVLILLSAIETLNIPWFSLRKEPGKVHPHHLSALRLWHKVNPLAARTVAEASRYIILSLFRQGCIVLLNGSRAFYLLLRADYVFLGTKD